MTKRVLSGFLITGSLIFNAVFIGMWIAHAVPRRFMERHWCGLSRNAHHGCALQRTLSMSDSQWTVLRPGIESFRGEIFNLNQEIEKNRAGLLDELEKTPTDSAALSARQERIAACQKKKCRRLSPAIFSRKRKCLLRIKGNAILTH